MVEKCHIVMEIEILLGICTDKFLSHTSAILLLEEFAAAGIKRSHFLGFRSVHGLGKRRIRERDIEIIVARIPCHHILEGIIESLPDNRIQPPFFDIHIQSSHIHRFEISGRRISILES